MARRVVIRIKRRVETYFVFRADAPLLETLVNLKLEGSESYKFNERVKVVLGEYLAQKKVILEERGSDTFLPLSYEELRIADIPLEVHS